MMLVGQKFVSSEPVTGQTFPLTEWALKGPLETGETELDHNAWGKCISLSTLREAYDIVRESVSSQANMDAEGPVQTNQRGRI